MPHTQYLPWQVINTRSPLANLIRSLSEGLGLPTEYRLPGMQATTDFLTVFVALALLLPNGSQGGHWPATLPHV